LQFSKRPQVIEDIIEIATFLAQENMEASDRFIHAVEEAFTLLAQMPEVGAVQELRTSEGNRIRRWRVKGFERFLIFYASSPEEIVVLRVLHGSRNLRSLFED
jgi:toxin ParE1/3/4